MLVLARGTHLANTANIKSGPKNENNDTCDICKTNTNNYYY